MKQKIFIVMQASVNLKESDYINKEPLLAFLDGKEADKYIAQCRSSLTNFDKEYFIKQVVLKDAKK